jgi:hypothetical protein
MSPAKPIIKKLLLEDGKNFAPWFEKSFNEFIYPYQIGRLPPTATAQKLLEDFGKFHNITFIKVNGQIKFADLSSAGVLFLLRWA